MKRVLGIGGSPRRGGNSDILMKRMLTGVQDGGVETEEVQLRNYQFQSCIGCELCRRKKHCVSLLDGMQLIYPKIEEASGLIAISPIYSYNMTALMKAFIDRLSAFYDFSEQRPGQWASRLENQGRKAIVAAIGEQPNEAGGMDLTLETFRRSINALGYEIIGELPVMGIFHKGRIKDLPEVLDQAEALGRKLAALL